MANGQNFPSSLNPVGPLLTQPVAPIPGAPQQADPGLWRRFLTSLQQDPRLQQALLTTGLTMLGDPQPGESGFGTFSRAALGGVEHLNRMREIDRTRDLQERVQALSEQQAADITDIRRGQLRETGRRTDIMEERTTMSREQFDERMNVMREQIQASKDVANIRAGAVTAGVTGAERLEAARTKALVDFGVDPKKAPLIAAGLLAPDDPQAQLRARIAIYQELSDMNPFLDKPLTDDELVTRTQEIVDAFSTGETVQPINPLEGSVNYQGQPMQIVQVPGKDRYFLVDATGTQSPGDYSRDFVEQLRRGSQ